VQPPVTKAGKRKLGVNSCEKREKKTRRDRSGQQKLTPQVRRGLKRVYSFSLTGKFGPLPGPKKHGIRLGFVQ
jgi:hypothetical protein